MGLMQMIQTVYNAKVGSGSVRYVTYPVGIGVAAVSDGAAAAWAWAPYVQILAAAAIANPCWLVGAHHHTGAVETFYGDYALASGEAVAEVDLIIYPIVAGIPTAVGVSVAQATAFPYPIRVAGSPRLATRLRKDTAASAAGTTMKVLAATAVGS